MAVKKRPFGVMLLAILEIIYALNYFGSAAAPSSWFLLSMSAIGATLMSVVLAILGIISLLLAYGLWTGMGWSWTLAIIFAAIGILTGIASLLPGIISIIIGAIIIYYLMMPHVKAFFKKAPMPTPPA
jgi:ABC-type Mn2+/Zn2+ transport system permease subunit